ncbi:MAG TPA: ATP-binding cassette domain-containing protein, partial [Acidimicrobiales bacterium]|nr:ATP-binding cassette domain-containing protein [Acidimicrobiales bacterium]
MITFDNVTIRYGDDRSPVVRDVDLQVEEGELLLVVGPTGVGKSTLLWAVNGLVPHFTGGHLSGRVTVAGRDTRTHKPRELADIVGVVGQDPPSGFVTDTVEEELAYGMEQLALAPDVMRKRVEETLDVLGIAGLRDRPLATLSGGEAQRVAIGTVLTAHPRILVLDEPTSALDPVAAEEVLAAVTRLVHDLGLTVVVAEHRLERVVQYADRVAEVRAGGTVAVGAPGRIMATSGVAPPVVELGRLARWEPLPLSVRDARRVAGPLRRTLASRLALAPASARPVGSSVALSARDLVVRYGSTIAVRQLGVALAEGEIVALMGRNGSGKSSLLWALQGSGPSQGGAVTVGGADPRRRSAVERRRLVGLVPQTPSDLLYLDRVADELAQADRESSTGAGSARSVLDRLLPGVADETHPRDLSEGQRLALVLVIQLVARPRVVLLDEPTRGLDYHAKRTLSAMLGELAGAGTAVVVATHDVEFAAATAARVVVMAAGEI